MLRKRQQQPAPETSALDAWVSSDSHFVPARQNTPDGPPPPRPSLSKAATAATSLLGFDCLASGDAHQTRAKPSPGGCGSGGQNVWGPRTRQDSSGSHPHAGSAASFSGRIIPGRATLAAGASPGASGLPETPSLRSPEWSPRRSRSSGSAPSPSPLLTAKVAVAPAAAAAAAAAQMPLMASAIEPQRQAAAGAAGEVQSYSTYAGWGCDAEGHVGGVGGVPVWVEAEGGQEWRMVDESSGAGAGSEGGWRSGSGGADGGRVSGASHEHPHGALPAAGPGAAAPPPLGPDSRDLSFVLGMLAAVRCAANAVRGMDAAGGGGTAAANAGRFSRQPGATGGSSAGSRQHSCKGRDFGAAAALIRDGLEADLPAHDNGCDRGGLQVQSAAGLSATATAADGGAAALTTSAVVAAPTSILLLVLAVRLFRAATRWPVAASLCAAATAVLAAWLAAAAALFAVAGAAGRTVHLLARITWAAVAWCVGSRGAPPAQRLVTGTK